jgi:F-type H+-transporting ATPase subunit b
VLIDWFTVVAQVINFLVLVALLRRFLYGPIVKAMDERQARIVAKTEEAEAERKRAEEEAQSYRQRLQELEGRREALLAEAKSEAEARRVEMAAAARAEIDEVRARWHRAIQQERESFLDDLRRRADAGVVDIARRALADLAGADLERQVAEVFVRRLRHMEVGEREMVARSVSDSEDGVVVQSAFPLPDGIREMIATELRKQVPAAGKLGFETAPNLISGIELRTHGGKVGWSVADYLQTLEASLSEALVDEAWEQKQKAGSEG